MRFLQLYLICYFMLLLGAVWALWQSGILNQIPGVWIAAGAIIAVGLGIMCGRGVWASGDHDSRVAQR